MATFDGVYLRPNLVNGGTVPVQEGPLCTSPDIWVAGTTPIANYQDVLATADSYNSSSQNNVTENMNNYFYVRGYNGTTATASEYVFLYYAPSGVIQWPAKWVNNVIQTDSGSNYAQISDLAPSTVGVANGTFIWENVPPPPSGSDHYCLFAQFNDNTNSQAGSNPFPNVYTQVDMSALITNNLGWGWRNVTMVQNGALFTVTQTLDIPSNVTLGSGTYYVFLQLTNYQGFEVSFQASETDSKGNNIGIQTTPITSNNQLLGVYCYLQPGFSCSIGVTLYNPNNLTPQPGANIELQVNYQTTTGAEEEMARSQNLVNENLMSHLQATSDNSIPINPMIPLGSVTLQAS